MSSLKKNLFLSVFGAAMSATVAFAADLPAPPVIEYEPETPIEIGSGWYLRGDLGFAVYQGGDASWQPQHGGLIKFSDQSIDDGWVIGGGAGYYFNQNLRGDVTFDWRGKVKYEGKAPCYSPCGGTASTHTVESNNFSAWTLMLNGYYDFGYWNTVTPYVGAGIGMASVKVHDYASSLAGSLTFSDKTTNNFAWNLMAGAAFDISHNVKLDANYRFVSLGAVKTGGARSGSGDNPVKYDNLYAHDFRVGLRYDLN